VPQYILGEQITWRHAPPLQTQLPAKELRKSCALITSTTSQVARDQIPFKLCLSNNDDSVVLPAQLHPASPTDFILPLLRGNRRILFFVQHQHSAWRYISSHSFLPLRRAPLFCFLPPVGLSIFYQRRLTFEDSTSPLDRQPHSSISRHQRLAST
jgi:hypothetical protein